MSEGSLAMAERAPPPTPTSPPEPLRPASTPVASPPKPEDDGPATVAEMEREQLEVAAAKKKGTATGKDSAGGKAKGKLSRETTWTSMTPSMTPADESPKPAAATQPPAKKQKSSDGAAVGAALTAAAPVAAPRPAPKSFGVAWAAVTTFGPKK